MRKFEVVILLTIVFKCNGHLRILGDILSSAHDRLHSKVQNVAGTVLGGLSHGVNINIESHIGISGNRQPGNGFQQNFNQNGYNPNKNPETVVVIKEEDNQNNYRPSPGINHQQANNPPFNNNLGNKPMNNYNQRPNYNTQNEQGNYNNGLQHQGNNNYNQNDQHHGSIYGQPNNEHSNVNNFNQNNFDRPNYNNPNNNFEDNQPNTNGGYGINTQFPEKLPTELITKEPNYKPVQEETTKKAVKDDEPFFVPLNPNEYSYGGDKINTTAPKRDANNNQYENGDYNIDIRIKDE